MEEDTKIIVPDNNIVTDDPFTAKYKSQIDLTRIVTRERGGNRLLDNPYILPEDSGLPSRFEAFAIDIPVERHPTYAFADMELRKKIASGLYRLIKEGDFTADRDSRKLGVIYVPNSRVFNGNCAVGMQYILVIEKENVIKLRNLSRKRRDEMFQHQIEDQGQAVEQARAAAASSTLDMLHDAKSYREAKHFKYDDLFQAQKETRSVGDLHYEIFNES